MKKALYMLVVTALLAAACAERKPAPETHGTPQGKNLPGDSALYGLACDGSTDSILIFLQRSCDSLDTFNIINAREEQHVLGYARVGDELAVILKDDSTREAAMVVNISALQKQWCYMVHPTLRHQPSHPLPDSIMQKIMAPREYGIRLMRGGSAFSFGSQRRNNEPTPLVDFPAQKRYTAWHLFNGRLVLETDSAARQTPDTATILQLRRDTLVLRFADHEQTYYRKK